MAASVGLGILAGLGASQVFRLTPEFWSNVGIWILIGSAIAFLVDLLFVSPTRLLREADKEIVELRNRPPTGMHIEHVDTQFNVQISAGATLSVSTSSNTLIVGPDQEGILLPRGTFVRAGHASAIGQAFDATVAVIEGSELLDKPPKPSDISR
jgi:hypothetical protein